MASILKPLIDLGRQANFPFLYFFSLFLSVISIKFVSIKIQKKSAEQWKINPKPLDNCRNDNIIKPQYWTKHLSMIKIDILINSLSSHLALTDALLHLDFKCSSWNEKTILISATSYFCETLLKRFPIM